MPRFRLTPPKPLPISENHVEKQCTDLLKYRGYYPVRLHSGVFRTKDNRFITVGERGLPDYAVLHRTFRGFFLETKKPGQGVSPEQAKKHWELRKAYGLAVVTIARIEDLIPWLDEHEKTAPVDPAP